MRSKPGLAVWLALLAALALPAAPAWAGWQPAQPVTGSEGASEPVAALGADGTAAVAWTQKTQGAASIRVAIRPAGAVAFRAPVTLDTPAWPYEPPAVAIGPDGRVTVLWVGAVAGGPASVIAATRASAGSFGNPVVLSPSGLSTPELATTADGSLVAAWYAGAATHYSFATPAGAFGTPRPVQEGSFGVPELAVAQDGEAFVAWGEGFPDSVRLRVSRRSPGGEFEAPTTVAEDALLSGMTVATGGGGQALVAWTRSEGDCLYCLRSFVHAAQRAPDGDFGEPVQVAPALRTVTDLRSAVDSLGSALLAWVSSSGDRVGPDDPEVRASVRPAGGAFDQERRLSDTCTSPRDLELGQDAGGGALLLWTARGRGARPEAITYRAGAGFGRRAALSPPRLAIDGSSLGVAPAGGALAAWRVVDRSGPRIETAVYLPAGEPGREPASFCPGSVHVQTDRRAGVRFRVDRRGLFVRLLRGRRGARSRSLRRRVLGRRVTARCGYDVTARFGDSRTRRWPKDRRRMRFPFSRYTAQSVLWCSLGPRRALVRVWFPL